MVNPGFFKKYFRILKHMMFKIFNFLVFIIKYSKIKQTLTHQSWATQTKVKEPKERHKTQRPAHSHTQKSLKISKLEP